MAIEAALTCRDALACETATPGRHRQVASILVGATVAATGDYQMCGALLRARLEMEDTCPNE